MLEDRTIKALRGEAVLTPARWSRRPMPRLLVGAAAGLLLYLGGLATGQWLATRQTADALKDLQQNNAMQAATLVQRTGSAYAEAIAALSRIPASTDSQYVVQGREVALSALIAAANQIVNSILMTMPPCASSRRSSTGTLRPFAKAPAAWSGSEHL
jgi:hypothetical protein